MNMEYERKSYLAAECKICDEYVVSDSETDYISLRVHENYSGPQAARCAHGLKSWGTAYCPMIFYFVRIKNPEIAAAISLVIASYSIYIYDIIFATIFWLALK